MCCQAQQVTAVHAQGIEREYEELDTVWYLAGSLFKSYPFDSPTEAFSLNLFRQVGVRFCSLAADLVIKPSPCQTCHGSEEGPVEVHRGWTAVGWSSD